MAGRLCGRTGARRKDFPRGRWETRLELTLELELEPLPGVKWISRGFKLKFKSKFK
jgi:hypothetical protein